jgi:hypothetical protein
MLMAGRIQAVLLGMANFSGRGHGRFLFGERRSAHFRLAYVNRREEA